MTEGDHDGAGTEQRDAVRLWLRLLTCTTMIERAVRSRLREAHATSLARFDLMAQLARAEAGLTAGEASAAMMVTGGNVTGLVDRLEAEGLVERSVGETDRRTVRLALTPLGRTRFDAMAADHAKWIASLMEGLPAQDRSALMELLGHLKASVADADGQDAPERAA